MTSNFDKFTERSRKVLFLSQQEAQRFDHSYIGTEHLLLALINETDGIAARVLGNLGVQLPKARAAVEFIVGRGAGPVTGDIGLTPRAKKVIELAVDEARRLDHSYIGTEHLLLGLIGVPEGVAVETLDALEVDAREVRQQIMQAIEVSQRVSDTEDVSNEAIAPPKLTRAQRIEIDLKQARAAGNPKRVRELEERLTKIQLWEFDDRKYQLVSQLIAVEQKRLEIDDSIRKLLVEIDQVDQERGDLLRRVVPRMVNEARRKDDQQRKVENDPDDTPSTPD
jgi:ATP-dependent Clp protease ATP-binding subunit ClpC